MCTVISLFSPLFSQHQHLKQASSSSSAFYVNKQTRELYPHHPFTMAWWFAASLIPATVSFIKDRIHHRDVGDIDNVEAIFSLKTPVYADLVQKCNIVQADEHYDNNTALFQYGHDWVPGELKGWEVN